MELAELPSTTAGRGVAGTCPGAGARRAVCARRCAAALRRPPRRTAAAGHRRGGSRRSRTRASHVSSSRALKYRNERVRRARGWAPRLAERAVPRALPTRRRHVGPRRARARRRLGCRPRRAARPRVAVSCALPVPGAAPPRARPATDRPRHVPSAGAVPASAAIVSARRADACSSSTTSPRPARRSPRPRVRCSTRGRARSARCARTPRRGRPPTAAYTRAQPHDRTRA